MKCPYTPNLLCAYLDTAGMDKTKECQECEHFNPAKAKLLGIIRKGVKPIQVINHFPKWQGISFLSGKPGDYPSAFHLIYKWCLCIAFWEIRKFLNNDEMKAALEIYNSKKD